MTEVTIQEVPSIWQSALCNTTEEKVPIIPRSTLPVKLVYVEEYPRIDHAFYREKQVQGWSRKKKEALIEGKYEKLPELAIAYRDK